MKTACTRFHTQHYDYFSLRSSEVSVLPDGCGLVIHPSDGRVTLVDWSHGIFLAECAFTTKELPLILALLDAWPSYCPYARLLSFLCGEPEESIAKRLKPLLAEALQLAIAPAREELKGYRQRLALLGLCIRSVYETGYLLCPLESPSQQEGKLVSFTHLLYKRI
jgi:hypothetical protein